jgi:hypothetical protein
VLPSFAASTDIPCLQLTLCNAHAAICTVHDHPNAAACIPCYGLMHLVHAQHHLCCLLLSMFSTLLHCQPHHLASSACRTMLHHQALCAEHVQHPCCTFSLTELSQHPAVMSASSTQLPIAAVSVHSPAPRCSCVSCCLTSSIDIHSFQCLPSKEAVMRVPHQQWRPSQSRLYPVLRSLLNLLTPFRKFSGLPLKISVSWIF